MDWGIHWIDAIRTVLSAGDAPRSVQAAGGLYALRGRITTPDALTAHFEFDGVPVTWTHRIFGAAEYTPATTQRHVLLRREGDRLPHRRALRVVIPIEKGAERRTVEAKGDQQTAHVAEWLEAVRTRGKVSCPPEDAYRSTAAVQLAMVALKAGGRVDWDAGDRAGARQPEGGGARQARVPRAVGAPVEGLMA